MLLRMKRVSYCLFFCGLFLYAMTSTAFGQYDVFNLKGEVDLQNRRRITIYWNNDPQLVQRLEKGEISDLRLLIDVRIDQKPYLSEAKKDVFSEDALRLSHTFDPFSTYSSYAKNSADDSLIRIRTAYRYIEKGKFMTTAYGSPLTLGYRSAASNGSAWSKPYVDMALKLGILPDDVASDLRKEISRYTFVKMMMQLDEYIAKHNYTISKQFQDTNDADINGAYNLGIVNGVAPGIFGADAPLTKEEMLVILARYLEMIDVLKEASAVQPFSDVQEISDWALMSAQKMKANGIVQGDDAGRLIPRRNVSREESIAMIVRIFERMQ